MTSKYLDGLPTSLIIKFSRNYMPKGPPFYMMTSSNGNIFRVTGPLCGEFTDLSEFPAQRPVTRSFDVFFDLRLNKRLGKQPWGWWFGMPSWSLWRQCNDISASVFWTSLTKWDKNYAIFMLKSNFKLLIHFQSLTAAPMKFMNG